MLKIIFQAEESPPAQTVWSATLLQQADTVTWSSRRKTVNNIFFLGSFASWTDALAFKEKKTNVVMWWVQLDALWQIKLTLV